MPLSEDAIRLLDDLGYASDRQRKFFQSIWDSEGEAFFWGYLEKEKESRDLCHRWAPQLREYATQCRRNDPLPTIQSLSVVDRAKYEIFCDKISDSRRKEGIEPRKNGNVVILHSSRVGLLAVQHVLGPPTDSVVHLLDEENAHWFKNVYNPEGEPFWWYSFFWWAIANADDLHEFQSGYIAENYPRPDGFTYWVVTDGCQWGDLAGGADHELWKWDGTNAKAIEVFCVDTY